MWAPVVGLEFTRYLPFVIVSYALLQARLYSYFAIQQARPSCCPIAKTLHANPKLTSLVGPGVCALLDHVHCALRPAAGTPCLFRQGTPQKRVPS